MLDYLYGNPIPVEPRCDQLSKIMPAKVKLPFVTLLLLISFASANAVLYTPALPAITRFFAISSGAAQQTMTWFLVGYTLGQLLYGPIANRFGRKPALYAGILLQIISSILCIIAGVRHEFFLLILGRFLLALGSGVGLKMTFTLVNECYEPTEASSKISYLMLSFAITPGLAVALGGVVNTYFGWTGCFYASAVYGGILLWLVSRLPETQKVLDYDALKLDHLYHGYVTQFKNFRLITGGFLMGVSTCFVYVFAALAPFVAMDIFSMSSAKYGIANLLPPIGLLLGSLVSAKLAKKYTLAINVRLGVTITTVGVLLMLAAMLLHFPVLFAVFLSTIVVYFGLCFILANASTIAMSHVVDKAHGAAVMSFINMGTATCVVLMLGLLSVTAILLPVLYCILCLVLWLIISMVGLQNKAF